MTFIRELFGPYWAFWLFELGMTALVLGGVALHATMTRPDPKGLWRWSHKEDRWVEDEVLPPLPRSDRLIEHRP